MTRTEKIILILFAVAAAAMIAVTGNYFWNKRVGTDATPPAPSYQEKNLEILKTARHDDLVLCVAKKVGEQREETEFAFLVDQNDETNMTGYQLNQYRLDQISIAGGISFRKVAKWKCEMRVLQGNAAKDRLSSIIFDGRNPTPAK